jgi:hypothetical protein
MTDRTEAMDNLIAQDADLLDTVTERVAEVTETDCNVAEYIAGDRARDLDYQVVALHRQYAYDQGYYDGRKMDAMEERAKIVAWLWGMGLHNINDIADAIEAGEHLK